MLQNRYKSFINKERGPFEGFPYLCNKTYRYQKKAEINPEMIKKKREIDPDDDDDKYLRLNSLI